MSPSLDSNSPAGRRGLLLTLGLAVAGTLGCRERGHQLEPDVGPKSADVVSVSAHAEGRATRSERPAEPNASLAVAEGVRRGFSDASGGASLTNSPPNRLGGTDARIHESLHATPIDGMSAAAVRAIEVEVADGRVVLRGTVPSREARDAVERHVRTVVGERVLENRLEVREQDAAQPAE